MIARLLIGAVLTAVAFTGLKSPEAAAKPVYDLPTVGAMKTYITNYEDTFVQIARDHNIGYVELRAANPHVDPWMPGDKAEMTIPTMHILPDAPREGIVINLPEMRLYHFPANGRAPDTHPLGIGREGLQTPLGRTTVVGKRANPTWRPTARMRREDPTLPAEVPPGPENPLGTHMMYLGWPEYGIHGTNKPYGIGRRSSSGCIRMYPEDILTLFPQIKSGTVVTAVDQPVKAAWIGDDLFVEAHPTMEQANRMEIDGGLPTYNMSNDEMRQIMKVAGPYAQALDWEMVRTVIRERRGYPIAVATKPAASVKKGQDNSGATADKADDSKAAALSGDHPAAATPANPANKAADIKSKRSDEAVDSHESPEASMAQKDAKDEAKGHAQSDDGKAADKADERKSSAKTKDALESDGSASADADKKAEGPPRGGLQAKDYVPNPS